MGAVDGCGDGDGGLESLVMDVWSIELKIN